ncbi:MAG: ABC transporter ATP-binding protein [Candidatus Latescibacteria bacterium]|nr:ABC transporter ATP-binding protein [Candidatus Latescibacterota bacterium]
MNAMIAFENVTKRYGSKAVLSDLSFEVMPGEFYGYLGPNGAGKTTTIKSIIGLVKPDEGRVVIDGIDVSENPLEIRSIVGYVPDNPFLYGKLTAREFFRFVGGLYRMERGEIEKRINWLCDIFDMYTWIDQRTEEYSFGMRKKVVMSASFLHRPKLIVVDEPTVGLDPPSARLLKDMMTLIQEHGTTVFMSSHDLAVVGELCNRIAILHQGAIAAEGTLDELRDKAEMAGGSLEQLFLKLTDNVSKRVYMD